MTGYPLPSRSGQIRHFVLSGDRFEWYDEPQYRINQDTGERQCISVSATFIPAKLSDNRHLEESDPTYRQNLEQLSESERERYLNGNWLASSQAETEWPRELFLDLYIPIEDFPSPDNRNCVRMFTLDASKGKSTKKGDYSAIVCLAQTSDLGYIDADIARRPPGQIVEDVFAFCDQEHHRIRSGDLIGIESLQFQELFRNLMYAYADSHREYALSKFLLAGNPIIPIEDTLNKMLRIRRLDGPLRKRQFRFVQNPGTTLLLQQLKQFDGTPGAGKYDDGPDALDMCRQLPIHRDAMYSTGKKKR